MKRLKLTPIQDLIIDETRTVFIEDDRYREALSIYLPELIRELIKVNNQHNTDELDHFNI